MRAVDGGVLHAVAVQTWRSTRAEYEVINHGRAPEGWEEKPAKNDRKDKSPLHSREGECAVGGAAVAIWQLRQKRVIGSKSLAKHGISVMNDVDAAAYIDVHPQHPIQAPTGTDQEPISAGCLADR